jgi:hypothetical protein
MLAEREVFVPVADAGRPSKIVNRHRVQSGLSEPLCQLLVERVQAADVGQDDDRTS